MHVFAQMTYTKRSPFLSSIGKQKFMRFRIVRESIGYGGGFMSITLEIFVLYLFCNLLNDPFRVIVMFPENILKDLVSFLIWYSVEHNV